ncbi:MAG TPA: TetR/AcrR family transcriptional regulator, partial [Pseudonocardia sp.]|nr:TetR/AcrR family transcriptional regulator [Pseudonocardia sp.]
DSALDVVAEQGPATLSLREVARRAGVSHAAPTHHFADKTGLLTALAAEGWGLLAEALTEAGAQGGDFGELGVAYVLFATGHPAHFAVMRAPGLVRDDDPALRSAKERAAALLHEGSSRPDGTADPTMALAGWSLVHGLATLLLEGTVEPEPGSDVATLARSVTRRLWQPR